MTKKEFIESVRIMLNGGNSTASTTGKFHPVLVAKISEVGYNDLVREMSRTGQDIQNLVKPFFYTVAKDTDRDQYYIESSVDIDRSLVKLISAKKNPGQDFAIIDNNSEPMWNELDVSISGTKPGAMIENTRIYFDEMFPVGLEEIMVKMVPTFSSLSNTDRINVPLKPLYDSVMQAFSDQGPDSDYNQDSPKQV